MPIKTRISKSNLSLRNKTNSSIRNKTGLSLRDKQSLSLRDKTNSSQRERSAPEASAEDAKMVKTKKVCAFCEAKTLPTFTDSSSLRRYLSDRAKIRPRARTGVCSKHQRQVTKHIKYARHLALLPFISEA